MHRFFLPPGSLQSGLILSLDDYAHQVSSVLRLAPGDSVLLLDGSGLQYEAVLTHVTSRTAAAQVGEPIPCLTEPRLQLALFACTVKADKFEWVLQKGTELGVSRFVPVVSRRSVVRPASALTGKSARWQAIVREAAEQSGRARLPEVAPALTFADAIALDLETRPRRFLAWEERAGSALRVAGTVADAAREGTWVALLVGPEGGFDAEEVAQAEAAGWQTVELGTRILRAETAAIAGVAALMALAGELGSFSTGAD